MNQYQPYYPPFNPYQAFSQSQPVQSTQHTGITGRIVNSPDEITIQEVPTDGTMGLFPSADGTCIYGKRWKPDGTIKTTRFVADSSEVQADPVQELTAKVD